MEDNLLQWMGNMVWNTLHPKNLSTLILDILYTGKILPRLYFCPFALWFQGEFKTGPIELCSKDYVTKLESGQIQDGTNQFQLPIG